MYKLIVSLALAFSSFSALAAYEEKYITSADKWNFFLQSVGGKPLFRGADGTLSATVVGRGKGSEYGQTLVIQVVVNCRTGQINQDYKGWETPKTGSIKEALVSKICNMS